MTRFRTFALSLAAVLASACAATPKHLATSDDVNGAPAPAVDPVASAPSDQGKPAPGTCTADADCATGQRCDGGTCAAAPAACSLVRVQFGFDSAQLDARATRALRDDAVCLQNQKSPALLIEGHCDDRGTTEYNIALGSRRAEAVKKYLADLGVKTQFETVSFGKELPVAQGESEAAWAQNRRAELRKPGEKRSDGQLVSSR